MFWIGLDSLNIDQEQIQIILAQPNLPWAILGTILCFLEHFLWFPYLKIGMHQPRVLGWIELKKHNSACFFIFAQ